MQDMSVTSAKRLNDKSDATEKDKTTEDKSKKTAGIIGEIEALNFSDDGEPPKTAVDKNGED